ncbi:MAG: hypothetical protein PWP07_1552 [Epulopiscium sp.]|jgi:hypothetical protein|uniref:Uncharacterized protein n=1 Tax=Defluviitalea raffinosedens TaxID=1450156 RepID=A0A7C8HDQ4_9FIRM|nr:hypothetical protein [Defluviitalea raffinosedens]MBZ4667278.1 hypothetical protein [Defluviitaleaceae bacterium]MDK2788307.1 hypothetical protein [Candidatus Epulonipiscium sp.]KAE9632032.1 hypothetical protein GND95_10995 [Defluviitalea raffinosedens]MBM7686464.1 hypothetical protein [Defluviitalea raffinosedens]HHW66369.1 hypothetical protein [Candidatus Epulonipiscium sp.]
MNIYKLIEEHEEELKSNLESRMSIMLNRPITISEDQWYKILQGTLEDIEYNIIFFNKNIDKEYVFETMKSFVELHVLRT